MTIKDIARESGYAVGTVSRVLNNHPDVSETARAKIMEVVEKHNFKLNNNAKHLKQQASNGIAIIVKGSQNMLFAAIVEQIRQLDYLEGVIFISFAWENLIDLRKIVPGQKAQFLTTRSDMELVQELTEQKLDLDIYYKSLTKQMLDACHENGLEVNCWTVDCAEEAEKLAVWGVDYITSNILE